VGTLYPLEKENGGHQMLHRESNLGSGALVEAMAWQWAEREGRDGRR